MHRGEEGEEEREEGGAEVAVFDVDNAVDAERGDAEAKGHKPEGVGRGSPCGVQAGPEEKENGQEGVGLGVVAHVAEDAHDALADDDDLEMQVHVGLDAFVEEGGVEPVGVGAVGELLVAEDGWGVEELFFGVLKMDVGGSEELRRSTLAYVGRRISELVVATACNRVHSHRQRLARWLLVATDKAQQHSLPVTHDVLAQMVGAQRPTVSPGLTRLAEQGTVCAEPDGWLINTNLTPAPPARRPE